MSFQVGKRFGFECAHHLPDHQGECSTVHGHSYKFEVAVWGTRLGKFGSETGMIMDFHEISTVVYEKVVDRLDHTDLNESMPELAKKYGIYTAVPPTAERLALLIFHVLKRHLRDVFKTRILSLKSITVWETDKCWARYEED